MRAIDFLGNSVEIKIIKFMSKNPVRWYKPYEFVKGIMYNKYKFTLDKLAEDRILLKKVTGARKTYKLDTKNRIVKLLIGDLKGGTNGKTK